MEQRTIILVPSATCANCATNKATGCSVLTGVLILLIFVFAPLQAVGLTAFIYLLSVYYS